MIWSTRFTSVQRGSMRGRAVLLLILVVLALCPTFVSVVSLVVMSRRSVDPQSDGYVA